MNRALLRFPGGDPHDPVACAYCPEMCRFSCPTAVVTGNDAVTPCNKNSLLHKERMWPGRAGAGGELWTLYDCTGCGRCTDYCVHGVPVADSLFEARRKFGWSRARETAARLADAADPVGDLADELGDEVSAERRLAAFGGGPAGGPAGGGDSGARVLELPEPRTVFFAGTRGRSAALSWQGILMAGPGDAWQPVKAALGDWRWLLAESPWLNRRLGRVAQVDVWCERALAQGLKIERAFAHGQDCIDTGGEGAYPLLFPEQAAQMARDFWERDAHRADAILTFSERAAAHLRKALAGRPGAPTAIRSLPEICGHG